MRGVLFALVATCLLPGCRSMCCSPFVPGGASDDCHCFTCTDGSESPTYRPPGPFWKRADFGCPCKCLSYQEERCRQIEDARMQGVIRGYR